MLLHWLLLTIFDWLFFDYFGLHYLAIGGRAEKGWPSCFGGQFQPYWPELTFWLGLSISTILIDQFGQVNIVNCTLSLSVEILKNYKKNWSKVSPHWGLSLVGAISCVLLCWFTFYYYCLCSLFILLSCCYD